MPGRGGRRAGAGRPRVTLADLVVERRFNASNARHCRALESDALPADADADLQRLQASYRTAFGRGDRSFIARAFEEAVQG